MIITLEDYLVQLHSGQWFGFNGEHIYDNLVIHSDEFAKPTEKECVDGVAKLQTEYDNKKYQRDRKPMYGTWEEQLDMMYHGTWKDHVDKIKSDIPKE